MVSKVTAKAHRILEFIKGNIVTSSPSIKEKTYKAITRPTLDYATAV